MSSHINFRWAVLSSSTRNNTDKKQSWSSKTLRSQHSISNRKYIYNQGFMFAQSYRGNFFHMRDIYWSQKIQIDSLLKTYGWLLTSRATRVYQRNRFKNSCERHSWTIEVHVYSDEIKFHCHSTIIVLRQFIVASVTRCRYHHNVWERLLSSSVSRSIHSDTSFHYESLTKNWRWASITQRHHSFTTHDDSLTPYRHQ